MLSNARKVELQMQWQQYIHALPLLIACLAVTTPTTGSADEYFREYVAPILQARCLSCHNAAEQQGEFSLQTQATAFADGHIEPGDADASYLIDLITPVDGLAEMPQDGPPLSDDEITAIRKWIDEGAIWPDGFELRSPQLFDFSWWSWQPMVRPALPDGADDPWVCTPVDAFVLARMREKGLAPSPPADRRTLIRRLTFDLHGLPPTPEDVESFVNDPDPDAYEKLVDRLLESPHYGERWARHWLDVVQYADTCGYDKDKLRPHAWPYRDYVIRSLNEDKLWSRFVQEQIAGDVLFPDEADGIIGLGFIAAGPWDFIGHVEVPESKIDGKVARNLDRDNMVTNTLNAFCSVTAQCARCHDHKHDPVSQETYYGLQAIFAAVDRADRMYDDDPQVAVRRRQLDEQLARLQSQLELLEKEIVTAGGQPLVELNRLITEWLEQEDNRTVSKDIQFGYHSDIAASPHAGKWVSLTFDEPVSIEQIILRPCHDEFAGIGAGFGFPKRFKVETSSDGENWVMVLDQTSEDFSNPGLQPLIINDMPSTSLRALRITATQLAERSSDYIFALAEVEARDPDGHNRATQATVEAMDSIEMPDRWGRRNLVDGRWPVWQTAESDVAGENMSLATALAERDKVLGKLDTPDRKQRRASIEQSIDGVRSALKGLPVQRPVYAAATHFPPEGSFQPTQGAPRPVFVLQRGDVQSPGPPAVPGVLPMPGGDAWQMNPEMPESERRATLARWLTDADHPMTWRSIVNRVWLYHFGEGLVSTPNDFGRMGVLPTHPDLLDWLAVEFRDNGQSLKQLHRLIVTSNVYRQSTQIDAERAKIDGSNQYLWRMNRRRLTAEEIRDSMLAVSGVLNPEMGGPGFYLFELEKTEHSPHYEYHKFDPADPATHRRSIYRFIVRSQPDPWMSTLDCADSSQSTPKRTETLTSLQALSLLNSNFTLEMAQRFADRLQADSDDVRQQVDRAMQWLVQRQPDEAESKELVAYAREHGLTNLCRFMFNLSEFVYMD